MELDDAFSNLPHIPNAEEVVTQLPQDAASYREKMQSLGRAEFGVPYGDSERQKYDLLLPEGTPKGLVFYAHAGYWRVFHRTDWSHLAEGANAQGWAVAIPSYDLCPAVSISEITRQMTKALEAAAVRVEGPIALAGHSAGGQMAARLSVPGVVTEIVAARIQGDVCLSPVSDLRPLLKTSMNADFQLDMAAAEAESPVLMRPLDIPVSVWVGGMELPMFKSQAAALAAAWDCELVEVPDHHHLNVFIGLTDPDSTLTKTLLQL